jgi:hypothetical protein
MAENRLLRGVLELREEEAGEKLHDELHYL